MKKNYEFPEENTNNEVNEPAIAYRKKDSIDDLRERFDRAVKQAESGDFLSHEEVKSRYKKL